MPSYLNNRSYHCSNCIKRDNFYINPIYGFYEEPLVFCIGCPYESEKSGVIEDECKEIEKNK